MLIQRPSRSAAGQRGFTLVELIVVIVIAGIMAAAVAARFFDRATYDVSGYTEQVRSLLRYGQKLAVAQNRPVYVRLNGSNAALCFAAACAVAERVPSQGGAASCATTGWACVDNPSGVTYASTASSFYFDALGKPFAASDPTTALVSTFATLTLSVSGSGITKTVLVEAETGYVH